MKFVYTVFSFLQTRPFFFLGGGEDEKRFLRLRGILPKNEGCVEWAFGALAMLPRSMHQHSAPSANLGREGRVFPCETD